MFTIRRLLRHAGSAPKTHTPYPNRRLASTGFTKDRHKLSLLHPKSVHLPDLGEGERARFLACRDAIFNNDYSRVAPIVEGVGEERSAVVMAVLVECLGKMGKVVELEQVLERWLGAGNVPTLVMAEVLINNLLSLDLPEKAKMWQERLEKQYRMTYGVGLENLWITFYLHCNNLPKAKEVFDRLRLGPTKRPNRQTYTSFYKHFLTHNDFSAAEQCKAAMLSAGFPLTTTFCNMQLSYYFHKLMLREVDAVLQEMQRSAIPKDPSTFDILVAGYARCGQREQMERWIFSRNTEYKMTMSQRSYARLIEALGMNMTAEQCRDLFQDLNSIKDFDKQFNVYVYFSLVCAFLDQRRYDEVVELFQEIQRLDLAMTEPLYARLAQRCIHRRFFYGLTFVSDEMKRHGVSKGALYYTALLQYHLNSGRYEAVDECIKDMFARGVALTDRMMCSIVEHLCDKAHYTRVRDILQWILDNKHQHYLHLSDRLQAAIQSSLYTYSRRNLGGVLRRWAGVFDRDLDESADLFDNSAPNIAAIGQKLTTAFPMVPFTPSVHVFNDVLVTCLRFNRFKDALEVFGEMRRQNVIPNRFTFTYLLKARIWMGQPDEAVKLLFEMPKYGLRPAQFQFGLVHHAHCRLGLTSEAERLLADMTNYFKVPPNHVFYASLLFAHCRRVEYTAVFRTFEMMERNGLQPDTETSNYVLLSLFDVGEYAEAMQFFSKMCLQGIRRNTYTYTILADRMLVRDDVEGVLAVLKDAFLDGNTIDSFPIGRILSYLHAKMAAAHTEQVVDLLVQLGIRIDTQLTPYCVLVMNRKFESLYGGNADPAVVRQTCRQLRVLVEKGLIDAEMGMGGPTTGGKVTIYNEEAAFWDFHDRLSQYYKQTNQLDQAESLRLFVEHLFDLRRCFVERRVGADRERGGKEVDPDMEAPSIADLLVTARSRPPVPAIFS